MNKIWQKSSNMKILVILGTRPDAIKMMPVIKRLKENEGLSVIVCSTGQHKEILTGVLKTFNMRLDYNLGIMLKDQQIKMLNCLILGLLNKLLVKEDPRLVLVHGDTSTALSSALAAYYQKIPVFHIEAGLRTYNKKHPFPEEINRQLIAKIADFFFAPTLQARINLKKEGVPEKNIMVTGNTGTDTLLTTLKLIKKCPSLVYHKQISGQRRKIIVLTVHRRENFGEPLVSICSAIKEIAERYKDTVIIFPVHPNPNVKNTVTKWLKNIDNVYLLKPLDYPRFVYLLSRAYLILTDSGGVQEEAGVLGKPLLILRKFTERPEIIESGLGVLVGRDKRRIIKGVERLMNNSYRKNIACPLHVYGDGMASGRIVNKIVQFKDEKKNR